MKTHRYSDAVDVYTDVENLSLEEYARLLGCRPAELIADLEDANPHLPYDMARELGDIFGVSPKNWS